MPVSTSKELVTREVLPHFISVGEIETEMWAELKDRNADLSKTGCTYSKLKGRAQSQC